MNAALLRIRLDNIQGIFAHNAIPALHKFVLIAASAHGTKEEAELCKITGMSASVVSAAMQTPYDLSNTKQTFDKLPLEVFKECFTEHLGRKPTFAETVRFKAVQRFLVSRYTQATACRMVELFFKEKKRFGWRDAQSEPNSLIMNKHVELFKAIKTS